jgi:hypothetical protein
MSKTINDKRNTLAEILNLGSGLNQCERIVKTKLDNKFKLDLQKGIDSCKPELEPDKCEEIVKTKLDNKYQIDLKHVMNLCKDKYINTNTLRSSRLASEKKAVDSAIQMSVDANDNLSDINIEEKGGTKRRGNKKRVTKRRGTKRRVTKRRVTKKRG